MSLCVMRCLCFEKKGVAAMIQPVKKAIARRHRSAENAKCAHCGEGGTLERPLMFVADTNRYWHYPDCMPAVNHLDERKRQTGQILV